MRRILILILALILLSGCVEEGQKIKVVHMSPRDMVEQLKLGQIDAFVAWEPFVSEAVVKGYGEVIAKSADIWPNHPCCVVAAKNDVGNDVLVAIAWAHVKATRFINDERNRDKVVNYAVEFTGRDENVVKEALKNIKFVEFPDKNEFRNYYKRLEESGYLKKNVKDLGYADEDEFFRNFLYDEIYQYVVSRLENDPSWMPEKANATVRMGYLTADLHQLAFYVALKEGYFEKVGIKIEKKEYANGVYEMEGFKAGEIDVGYLGGAPATLKRVNEDIEIKIIAGANNEGSAIVARDVDSLKDLTGKKVAIPGFGTVQDFLLRMAAEKEGTELEIG